MILLGFALLAGAVVLFVLAHRRARRARRLTAMENVTPAELVALHGEVTRAADVAGAFVQTVDTSGVVGCATPLVAPITATPCVYFRATVTAQIEELRTSTDSEGRCTQRWEREDRVVSDHEQGTTFELCDGADAVQVVAEGAKIDHPVVTVDRFEPGDGGDRGVLSIGGVSFGGSTQRLLGYRHVERILPVEARVFVHGTGDDRAGRLTFRAARGRPLMISTRSEEEIVEGDLRDRLGNVPPRSAAPRAPLW